VRKRDSRKKGTPMLLALRFEQLRVKCLKSYFLGQKGNAKGGSVDWKWVIGS